MFDFYLFQWPRQEICYILLKEETIPEESFDLSNLFLFILSDVKYHSVKHW